MRRSPNRGLDSGCALKTSEFEKGDESSGGPRPTRFMKFSIYPPPPHTGVGPFSMITGPSGGSFLHYQNHLSVFVGIHKDFRPWAVEEIPFRDLAHSE